MVAITPFPDPPNFDDADEVFQEKGDATLGALPRLCAEINLLEASLRAAATAGLPFNWITVLSGDPGPGNAGGNNATQTAITSLRFDIADALGIDRSLLFTWAGGSTNPAKGLITITSPGNAGKLLQFAFTAFIDTTGFFTATVTCVASSAPSPFGASESVVVAIDRTGNVGATGPSASFTAGTSITLASPSTTVTIPLTAGKAIAIIELVAVTYASGLSSAVYAAGSANGSAFTGDIAITSSSGSQWDGQVQILNYAADRQLIQSGLSSLASSSPTANQVQQPGAAMKVVGGMSHLRLAASGAQFAIGSTFKPWYL